MHLLKCCYVETEEELLEVYNKAKEKGMISCLITDKGLTEFNGVPTITCCAIGPAWSDELDEITGNLKLF
jgi:PTH2 family peptidyl-tRNA hydrolase